MPTLVSHMLVLLGHPSQKRELSSTMSGRKVPWHGAAVEVRKVSRASDLASSLFTKAASTPLRMMT
jgi:hypothetical protein